MGIAYSLYLFFGLIFVKSLRDSKLKFSLSEFWAIEILSILAIVYFPR